MAGVRSLQSELFEAAYGDASLPPDFLPLLRRRSPPVTTCQRRHRRSHSLLSKHAPALGTSFDDFDDGAAIMAFEQTDSIVRRLRRLLYSSMRRQEFIVYPVNGGTSSMGRHVGLRFRSTRLLPDRRVSRRVLVWVKCHRAIRHDVGVRSHCWGSSASALECTHRGGISRLFTRHNNFGRCCARRRDRLRLSILGHEYTPSRSRRFGVATTSIDLWALGGVARLASEAPSPWSEGALP